MRRHSRPLLMACLLAVAAACSEQTSETPPSSPDPEVLVVPPALVTTHAKKPAGACSSGCSLAKHPIPKISHDALLDAMATFAQESLGMPSEALDTLVFYGARTQALLETSDAELLSTEHRDFLEAELSIEDATIDIRMVELATGKERVRTGPRRIPLGVKQYLRGQRVAVQDLSLNGTVMRTGAHHLWARF